MQYVFFFSLSMFIVTVMHEIYQSKFLVTENLFGNTINRFLILIDNLFLGASSITNPMPDTTKIDGFDRRFTSYHYLK